MNLGDH
jgi:hypothetical protein